MIKNLGQPSILIILPIESICFYEGDLNGMSSGVNFGAFFDELDVLVADYGRFYSNLFGDFWQFGSHRLAEDELTISNIRWKLLAKILHPFKNVQCLLKNIQNKIGFYTSFLINVLVERKIKSGRFNIS